MTALVAEFNATNEYGITVEEIAQGRQGDLEQAVNAAIATGELPNVTAGFPNGLSRWFGLGVIAALNDFMSDPVYGTGADVMKDISPAAFAAVYAARWNADWGPGTSICTGELLQSHLGSGTGLRGSTADLGRVQGTGLCGTRGQRC